MLGGLFKKNKNNNNKLSFFTDTEHVDFNLRNLSCLRIFQICTSHLMELHPGNGCSSSDIQWKIIGDSGTHGCQ